MESDGITVEVVLRHFKIPILIWPIKAQQIL